MKRFTLFISFVLTVMFIVAIFAFASPSVSAADSGSTAGKITTTSSALNVRSGAGSSYSIIAGISRGSYITLISKTGSWWKVEYSSGQYGYCSDEYITSVISTAGYVNTASTSLNVRTGAGASYSIQGVIPRGTSVLILSEANGWSKILYNGTQTGYVSSSYIKKYGAYNYVSLDTANYKQTDSRWSATVLGGSGKTIADAGCTVTCLAITESYRLGYTITPNEMAARLNFTSGGAVYWSSNYVFYFNSDYLSVAYSKLSQGKPVIIGGKTSFGSTHYVVVTGFTGGALTAENFVIKDPGSATRTTLAQYFAKYNTFIKMAYYN